MTTYRVTAPDGTKFKVNAPEGATEEQALAFAQEQFANRKTGAVIPGTPPQPEPEDTSFLESLQAAGTGVGKMAKGALAAPVGVLGGIIRNILGGGYGTPEGAQKASQEASNFIGNAVGPTTPQEQEFMQKAGQAVQGLAPLLGLPSEMAAIGKLGAPATAQLRKATNEAVGGVTKPTAQWLMNSALKPTQEAHRVGDAKIAVDTLLKYGINPNRRGVEKIQGLLGDLNEQISTRIAGSEVQIPRDTVSSYIGPTRVKFGDQVAPAADLAAIENIASEFAQRPSQIPVQTAQKLKQGTYKVLAGKYGEAGSAATEAQKALARGLKEEIAAAVPEVADLNAKESALIRTLNVTERRALMDMNKNPMGLSLLAANPATWAAFMADKSALFKSYAARMLNAIGSVKE